MPKRIVNEPVIVHRDGKQVSPEVGKAFDFTDAEVKEIKSLNEKALGHIITADEPAKATKV